MQSSASRLFALPMPIHSEHFFCLSAQALAFPLPRCWVHIISAPPRLNAHLVFAVSVRVFVYPCLCVSLPLRHAIRFTASAAHADANLYRRPSSRRCPFLRHAAACLYDAILCLCLSSLCRSWRRLCRSIPATSSPLRCPSSLCLRASALVHAHPQPCIPDLIPALAVHIPAAADHIPALPLLDYASVIFACAFRCHCSQRIAAALPCTPVLHSAVAGLIYPMPLRRWSLPLLFGSTLCRCTSRSCSLPLRR